MAGRAEWRVLIVDDYPAFRETMQDVLTPDPRFQVVAQAASGEEAVKMADHIPIDLILMDLHLPGINGLMAAERIKTKHAQIVVLILSSDWSPVYERRAKAVGVRARLTKQTFSLKNIYRVLG